MYAVALALADFGTEFIPVFTGSLPGLVAGDATGERYEEKSGWLIHFTDAPHFIAPEFTDQTAACWIEKHSETIWSTVAENVNV